MNWRKICHASLATNKKIAEDINSNLDAIFPHRLKDDKFLEKKFMNLYFFLYQFQSEWMELIKDPSKKEDLTKFVNETLNEIDFNLIKKCDKAKEKHRHQLYLQDLKLIRREKARCITNKDSCSSKEVKNETYFDPVEEELTLRQASLWPAISTGASLEFYILKYRKMIKENQENSSFYSGVSIMVQALKEISRHSKKIQDSLPGGGSLSHPRLF